MSAVLTEVDARHNQVCVLGFTGNGAPVAVDLDALVGSHLAIIANSGGGKSGALRKLLETTHGRIQHIILDVEDEFYTLRERYDYVIAGGADGDVPTSVDGAAALARAALEHGFSLIVQLNDLGTRAPAYVASFLTSLMAAPRDLWHPVLVVLDEAQRLISAKTPTEALPAATDLLYRGRKRGFTAVLASLRMADGIAPEIRGMVNNWMLGRSGQALDRNTMADQLGFTAKEGRDLLRGMKPRGFWAVGPALSTEPALFKVADVETAIIKSGQAKVPTAPAPEALRSILAGLVVPPADGAVAGSPAAAAALSPPDLAELRVLRAERDDWTIERAYGQRQVDALAIENAALRDVARRIEEAAADLRRIDRALPIDDTPASDGVAAPTAVVAASSRKSVAPAMPAVQDGTSATGCTASARKMIDALARFYPRALSIEHAAKIAGVSPRSSQWRANRASFEASPLVKPFVAPGQFELSTAGRDAFGLASKPDDPTALLAFWIGSFPPATGAMLRAIADAQAPLAKAEVAARAGVSPTSSGLPGGLRELREHQLIEQVGDRYQLASALR